MCTTVKFDETVYTPQDGANFDDPRCMWWNATGECEILDGNKGRVQGQTGDASVSGISGGRLTDYLNVAGKLEKDGAAKRMTYKAAKSVLYRHFEGLQPQ